MVKCFNFKWPIRLLLLAFHHFFMPAAQAQGCGFSAGKTLHELQTAIQKPPSSFSLPQREPTSHPDYLLYSIKSDVPKRGVFLPRWSADDLPFFCKIEHDWAKNRARIPVKFRLGSVEYVDWLEGKGSY